jgi:hypothetical protein
MVHVGVGREPYRGECASQRFLGGFKSFFFFWVAATMTNGVINSQQLRMIVYVSILFY